MHGDTFLHFAIRNDHSNFVIEILNYFIDRQDVILSLEEQQQPTPLDIENNQEQCTPHMLAVLRELFNVADLL
jgi:ankyrin repeat protein